MWSQIINALLGLWLMTAPGFLHIQGEFADNGHIIGPIIVTFSVVAMWEATRATQKWNLPLALWLVAAPWILGYEQTTAIVSDTLSGILIFCLSMVKGSTKTSYGGGWSSLWRKTPEHLKAANKKEGLK